MKIFPLTATLALLAVPVQAEDLSSMADRWSGHIGAATDTLVGEARRWEGITGKIPLPGDVQIGVDDLLNEDPVALAEKIGRSYSAMVDGLAAARSDLDAQDFRSAITASFLGHPADTDDPFVIAAEIEARTRDLMLASEGSEIDMAHRMRAMARALEANAAELEEAAQSD